MNKTIAILCSLDTKYRECVFVEEKLHSVGIDVFKVDMTTRMPSGCPAQADVRDVLHALGLTQEDVTVCGKSDWIDLMRRGLSCLMPQWHTQGYFDGAMAIGGLQNTVMAAAAMQALPIGIPKLIVSTVACGRRVFDDFIGNRDVLLMHAVADIAGLNPVTRAVLSNATAAMIGMAQHGVSGIKRSEGLIAMSAMGVVSGCSSAVLEALEAAGREVVCFHSTGKGGQSMDEMIKAGQISSAVELSLHELLCEDVFGGGYALGSPGRLHAAACMNIPLVVTPAGLDFIDYSAEEFETGPGAVYSDRQYIYHNAGVVHIKVSPEEGRRAGEIVARRLNRSQGPVMVLLPLRGFRSDTQPGEALYNPLTDEAIRNAIARNLADHIHVEMVDANMNDTCFAQAVLNAIYRVESEQGGR